MTDPTNRKIADALNRRLSGLDHVPGLRERVLTNCKGEEKRVKKKWVFTLVLALMLALFSATAVAAGLKYSAQFIAIQQAKGALKSAYGLTDEMLQLFYPSARTEEGATIVTFIAGVPGESEQIRRMGEYTATLSADGGIDVAWSHDGHEADWQGKSLSEADVWAAPQLAEFLEDYHARLSTRQGAPLHTPGFVLETESAPAVTPEPGKITLIEAAQIAEEALLAQYENAAEKYFELTMDYDPEKDQWLVTFHGVEALGSAIVDATTGEILFLQLDSGAFSEG